MKKTIHYVTGNQGKFQEVNYFIQTNTKDIDLVQFDAQIPEIQTLDQKTVAMDKAIKAWEIVQKPLIVDDSAIYFKKYNKFPGTFSKYIYQGLGFEGMKKLIEPGDKATFFLYLVYVENTDNIKFFEGICEGTLVKPKSFSGNIKLPFDCFFIPDETTKTYAQMRNTQEGHNYFYRIKALKKFLEWWKL